MIIFYIWSHTIKVVNFISGKDLGGPKQSFLLYSEAISNLGHDVISVTRKGAPLIDILHSMKMNVKEVDYIRSINILFKKNAITKLREVLKPLEADIIFVHKQVDIELVREAVGDDVRIIGIIHGFNAKNIEPADALIAVSQKVKDFLLNNGYTKPIYVIPNMVKIASVPHYRDLPEIPLIGAMGIFRRKKGFHVLIKALSILKQRNIKFKAIIAGRGQLLYYLKYLRLKLDLKDELVIRDWVNNDERDEFVDSIDIYCLPSRTESFGMVVVEAMARMKRVIATRCGGPEEIITHGENGFLVEKQNPEAMADCIESLITNKVESNHMPQNAYDFVMDNYEITHVTNKISDIIDELTFH